MISFIEHIRSDLGRKPFFIYDLDLMSAHLSRCKVQGVKFWYATKANPLSAIVKTAYESGFGIDCASAGEFRQALRVGVDPKKILLTGPSKSKALLIEALDAGLRTFVLESIQQVRDLDSIAREKNIRVDGLLRLQITWSGTEASVLGGGKVSAFGIDAKGWSDLNVSGLTNIHIRGIHCFQWGNILDAKRLSQIWFQTAKEAVALTKVLNLKLEVLDLGGGLGIPYHGEAALEFELVGAELTALKKDLPETEIWMELGRYAIGAFGKYVTEVVDRKTVQQTEFLILEGGVHHLVRPALIGEAFPMKPLLNTNSKSSQKFEVHGPLCTSLDRLGTYTLPSETKPGDALVFEQVGAYGFTESMPFFLCHDLPAEFVIQNQNLVCLREWKSPESWMV